MTTARRRPGPWWPAAVVAVAALLPYLALPTKPLIYDSALAITRNAAVQSGPLSDLFSVDFWGREPDAQTVTRSYRPLVSLTWALQARGPLSGAWAYHAGDMLLHAGAAVLLLLVARRLGLSPAGALAAGLLFAVHPVQSEAVASGVGRADLMAAAALLGALCLQLGRPSRLGQLAALGLIAVGLLSKEYAVVFPLLLIGVDLARERADPAAGRRAWGFWIGSLVLLLAYLLLRYSLFGALGGVPMIGESDHPLAGQPLTTRLAMAGSVSMLALRLLILPFGLNHHYRVGTLPVPDSLADGAAIAGYAAVAILVALAVMQLRRRRDPIPAVGILLLLLPLAPALNVISLSGVVFAERLLYLPVAGLALILGLRLSRMSWTARSARVATGAGLTFLLLLGSVTARRVQDWSSIERLSRASIEVYPEGAEVWEHLGLNLRAQGRKAEAAEALGRSVALAPDRIRALTFHARTLSELGRTEEAVAEWRRTVKLLPEAWRLWQGLGHAEQEAGRSDAAARAFARAQELQEQARRNAAGGDPE